MIAFLGMGLLGSNFVRALRRRGQDVQVWNRSHDKAQALAADGAVPCQDVLAAVKGASHVHMALSDDAAVDQVLEAALPGVAAGTVIIDHTTTLASGIVARAARVASKGAVFQHAPVFMGPKNALDGTGIMMCSGDRARFDALEPHLGPMTGKLMYLGPLPERAAGMKLVGNLFLVSMMNSVFDMLGLAKALGIPATEASTLFEFFNPAAMLPARTQSVLKANFSQASWELAMARKDVRLMLEEARRGDVALTLTPAIAALMDAWIEKGHAHDDWSVIASDVVR
jgi:3-hydroxyisobutyrate dehydrogenase